LNLTFKTSYYTRSTTGHDSSERNANIAITFPKVIIFSTQIMHSLKAMFVFNITNTSTVYG